MKRTGRAAQGRETVELVARGGYTLPDGSRVDLAPAVRNCLESTRYFTPDALQTLRREVLARPAFDRPAAIEVVHESTLAGIARLHADGCGRIAALNFASARNPGGGFLNGSQAQEESLARSSALHASQMKAWEFYERHRADDSLLYSDAMIYSPGCPVFRDDDGALLPAAMCVDFVTAAAPNAGAIQDRAPHDFPRIPAALRRRCELVLALAASQQVDTLVLGAWGCGVFRNDPALVADAFADCLLRDGWSRRFRRIAFSILAGRGQKVIEAFQRRFA